MVRDIGTRVRIHRRILHLILLRIKDPVVVGSNHYLIRHRRHLHIPILTAAVLILLFKIIRTRLHHHLAMADPVITIYLCTVPARLRHHTLLIITEKGRCIAQVRRQCILGHMDIPR